jgi:hypothetical protein
MPTKTYQKRNVANSNSNRNPPNRNNLRTKSNDLASYEFEYRENKNPEYQYISDDSRVKVGSTRKDRSEMRRERHREEDDKFHIGLLFGCLVLSYLLNFAYGFQAGTTMYGVVFTIGLVIWAVVALMGYFREDKE